MSIEISVLPIADGNEATARLADFIEGIAGGFSPFEELHGFSIDGVDPETALRAAGVDPQARGETLTVEQFAAIAGARPRG